MIPRNLPVALGFLLIVLYCAYSGYREQRVKRIKRRIIENK